MHIFYINKHTDIVGCADEREGRAYEARVLADASLELERLPVAPRARRRARARTVRRSLRRGAGFRRDPLQRLMLRLLRVRLLQLVLQELAVEL